MQSSRSNVRTQDMAKAGKRWPKAEKGLDKDDSLYIFKTTGVFVAIGSGKYSYSIEQLIISHPANRLLNNRALSVRRLG